MTLHNEGKLGGVSVKFPLEIDGELLTQDELVVRIASEIEQQKKPKEISFADYLYSILWKYDIQTDGEIGTINLVDRRTMQLIQLYQFYKNNPHLIDNAVWYEAYLIMDRLTPRMF